jgi:hypothetical protein
MPGFNIGRLKQANLNRAKEEGRPTIGEEAKDGLIFAKDGKLWKNITTPF